MTIPFLSPPETLPPNYYYLESLLVPPHPNPIPHLHPKAFPFLSTISMAATTASSTSPTPTKKHVYSVWGLPPDDVRTRLTKVMDGLGSEFNGPYFEPHVTVVGAISLTEEEALDLFRAACDGLKAYDGVVDKVDTGTFFYQCVYLLLHPTPEVVDTSDHCCKHFGYVRSTSYMPHLSLLYGDLTDEDKKKAQERAIALDEGINSLKFKISRLVLYETDTEDKTLRSWKKVAECSLATN